MSDSTSIPVLFTLPPGKRHEVILIDTPSTQTLKTLNAQITATIARSPNCEEFMSKHKKQDEGAAKEQIKELKIRWSSANRDAKHWPESTLLTESNLPAILQLVKLGAGKDVLEIKLGTPDN